MNAKGFFRSTDGRRLFYRFFDAGPGADTLVILHGHGEHSGRYEKFARILEKERLSIAVFDFRGHGRSEGPWVFIRSFDEYIGDALSFIAFLDAERGLGKFFLLGHSMGGLVAVHVARRMPERLRALILSSPCLGLRLPPFLLALNALLNRVLPGFVYSNPVYPPYLTHNPEEVDCYKKDPLIRRKMSVSLLTQALAAMRRFDEEKNFRFPFPVFVLMAGMERIVDAEKTRVFFQRLEAPHKELKVFPGFYHEIFNELDQAQAFEALKTALSFCRAKS